MVLMKVQLQYILAVRRLCLDVGSESMDADQHLAPERLITVRSYKKNF